MSSRVSPASATAASHASMVKDSGGTISRRPSREAPIPVIAECCSNFSVRSIGRMWSPKRSGAISSAGNSPGSPATGRNSGSQTSSACWNTTSTGWPSSRPSGSDSTMLVVNRTRGSSSIATCATTYGGGRSGKPNRWLTVKPASVPRPDTVRTPSFWLRQYRQIGWGGWISDSQSWHCWMRSSPSAPAVQKNSFCAVTCGSGRPGMSAMSTVPEACARRGRRPRGRRSRRHPPIPHPVLVGMACRAPALLRASR